MKEIYLVDGYNVINYWQEFNGIRENDLEHARDLLVHRMSEFMAFHGYDGTVVFDAMDVAGPEEVEMYGSLRVVYTAENETADSWIEREAYQKARRDGRRVFVVTSAGNSMKPIIRPGNRSTRAWPGCPAGRPGANWADALTAEWRGIWKNCGASKPAPVSC